MRTTKSECTTSNHFAVLTPASPAPCSAVAAVVPNGRQEGSSLWGRLSSSSPERRGLRSRQQTRGHEHTLQPGKSQRVIKISIFTAFFKLLFLRGTAKVKQAVSNPQTLTLLSACSGGSKPSARGWGCLWGPRASAAALLLGHHPLQEPQNLVQSRKHGDAPGRASSVHHQPLASVGFPVSPHPK